MILVVEDSDLTRAEICQQIADLGLEPLPKEDGLEGYNAFIEHGDKIKLIITDLNMPRLDGIKMLEKMHEAADKVPPVIFATTESSEELKQKGKELGVVVWAVKPIAAEKFGQVLKKVIEKFA